jgi:chlorophyll/bacteriochlorophyll a synthase
LTHAVHAAPAPSAPAPKLSAVIELLKPITWFAPMWAFGCGVVSSGMSVHSKFPLVMAGAMLAGPLICGTSQAVNDWYDRHVDAINEPNRPIPSGRIPDQWGFYIAVTWSIVSLCVATLLGPWGFGAASFAMLLAWAYSAPPVRLKRNGWWGNSAVALCYEGVPWFTGAAVMAASRPHWHIIAMAALYSAGAHGIMTLNDFKSVDGDRATGIGSLPVRLGIESAVRLACAVMALPQAAVVVLLLRWGQPLHAAAVVALITAQLLLMQRLLAEPRRLAPWYNVTGTSLYVLGMLITAFALRP